VAPGEPILLDDGHLELKVLGVEGGRVLCEVVDGGVLRSNKGMNLPGVALSTPALTEKDRRDLQFGIQHQVDYVALSFVRRPEDVLEAKEIIRSMGETTPVIAKIEKPQAVDNLEAILAASDGVMVARGDLGVELGTEDVPIVQKRIIAMANGAGKVVITATQMLESMIENPRPTRAEASDVANAILDGTDAVMLSGESAVGKYPVETVETMARIAAYTEEHGTGSMHSRRADVRRACASRRHVG
jgi:pyruvate kinase